MLYSASYIAILEFNSFLSFIFQQTSPFVHHFSFFFSSSFFFFLLFTVFVISLNTRERSKTRSGIVRICLFIDREKSRFDGPHSNHVLNSDWSRSSFVWIFTRRGRKRCPYSIDSFRFVSTSFPFGYDQNTWKCFLSQSWVFTLGVVVPLAFT